MKQSWVLPEKYKKGQNIVKTFVSQATLAIYRQWIADEKQLSLEEIIELTTKLICNGVNALYDI